MIIRTKPDAEDIAKLKLTLSVTMLVSEWRLIREDLRKGSCYDSSILGNNIAGVIEKLERNLAVYESDGKNCE